MLKLSNLAAGRGCPAWSHKSRTGYAIYIGDMFRDSSGCSTFISADIHNKKRSLPIREKRIPDFGRAC
jgi:hypothetical protein